MLTTYTNIIYMPTVKLQTKKIDICMAIILACNTTDI